MERRTFVGVMAAGLLAAPLAAEAQPVSRVYRLGYLLPTGRDPLYLVTMAATMIPSALRELGYVEGRNLVIERRYAEGKVQRLPALARELVQLPVDLIVTVALGAARAARDATATIPIVMYGNFDPVAQGIVASLARPGGTSPGY